MTPTATFGPVRIYAGDKNGKYPDGHQLIVQGSDTRAVFDSPLVSNHIGADFDDADLVIQGHIHEDHVTGLHRLPGVPVYVHEGDLPAIASYDGFCHAFGFDAEAAEAMRQEFEEYFHFTPRPDALGYEDGMTWDLGGVTVRAIHLPGHTAGHCALLVEEAGVIFVGDFDLSSFGPFYGTRSSSLAAFRASLAKLRDIDAQVWVTSHHRGIYTDKTRFLQDLELFGDKFDQRSERLLQRLRAKPATVDEIAREGFLYGMENPPAWVLGSERWTVQRHLEELQAEGLVVMAEDRRFTPSAA